jgi:hypothetical protein
MKSVLCLQTDRNFTLIIDFFVQFRVYLMAFNARNYMKINTSSNKPLIIMVAGPFMSGTDGDPVKIAANKAFLEAQCLPIWELGHLPMIGEWIALPIIHSAGGQIYGDAVFSKYQYPVAQRLLARCDAVYRLAGASSGADKDVALATSLGLAVYYRLEDIPRRVETSA